MKTSKKLRHASYSRAEGLRHGPPMSTAVPMKGKRHAHLAKCLWFCGVSAGGQALPQLQLTMRGTLGKCRSISLATVSSVMTSGPPGRHVGRTTQTRKVSDKHQLGS
eukprot:4486978-Amphidinium_carterae.2